MSSFINSYRIPIATLLVLLAVAIIALQSSAVIGETALLAALLPIGIGFYLIARARRDDFGAGAALVGVLLLGSSLIVSLI